jgi:hypothetical protein
MFGEGTETDYHTYLWNINHVGNEAKDNPSKRDFQTLNGDRKG